MWPNRDPIGERGVATLRVPDMKWQTALSGNLFCCLENDPANNIDPDGLFCWTSTEQSSDPTDNLACLAICRVMAMSWGCMFATGSAVKITTTCVIINYKPPCDITVDVTKVWVTLCRCNACGNIFYGPPVP